MGDKRTAGALRNPLFLLSVGGACLFGASVSGQELDIVYQFRASGIENANALMAAELFSNASGDVPEIIATDNAGQMAIFESAKGALLVKATDTEKQPLTGPAVGDFDGDYRLDVAVGTYDGRVLILNGSRLDLMAEYTFDQTADNKVTFITPPTVVSLPMPGDSTTMRDVLVLSDQVGRIYALYMNNAGEMEQYWPRPVRTGSTVAAPISAGYPRSQNRIELVVPLSTGKIVLIDAQSGMPTELPISDLYKVATSVILADFNGDRLDDMVYTMDNGDIYVSRYDPSNERLLNIATFATKNTPVVGDPVLVVGDRRSPADGLIFQAGRSRLVACRVRDKATISSDVQSFIDINTNLSVIPQPGGYPVLVLGQSATVVLVATEDWFNGRPALEYPSISVGEPVIHTMPIVTVANRSVITGMTLNGRLFAINTGRPATDISLTPWMTRGATPARNNLVDREYFSRDNVRLTRLQERIQQTTDEWKTALEDGDLDRALELAEWRLGNDPHNVQYQKDYNTTWIRKHLLWLVLGGIVFVGVMVGLTFLVVRFVYLSHLERRARAAVAKGKMSEAEVLYEKLHSARPRNHKVIATLAMVYMSNKTYDAKTIEIFGAARERDPENQNLLHCFARALMKDHRYGAPAREIYEAAVQSFPEPQMVEYAIGMCYKQAGDFEEAAKRLRAALRGGLASDHVYSALCDVYLATNNRGAKALPVYRQQFPSRQNDQKFLECYLDSCIDAKQTDPSVESLCYLVLEGNASYVPAYCHLAAIYIQKNELGRAIEEVRHALEQEPSNQQAIMLLAQCFLVEGRSDDEAKNVLHRALEINPGDTELLRTLAEIYYRSGSYDAKAVEIYKRANAANPKDLTALKALAMTGRLGGDAGMVIRSIEALHELGYSDAELSKQLAEAYLQKNIYEPKAERVLRDALRAEPENKKYIAALAKVLTKQERETSDAIPVYEAQVRLDPSDRETGTQLCRAYIKSNRYEEALRTAQALIAAHPEDGELQRLVALSSLYDNKIDEAAREYQSILERNPNDKEAQYHLAMAWAQKGRADDESARMYQRALAFKGDSAELYLALGRVHFSRGDAMKAVENYQQVLKAQPGSEEMLVRHVMQRLAERPEMLRVRWFLCEVLVAYNRLREALDQLNLIFDENPNHARNILGALEKILAKDAQNVQALSSKARILVSIGDYEGARESLERSYKLQPNSPEIMRALANVYERMLTQREDVEIRFRLGRVYYMMQEYDKAIGCFQKTSQDYRWEAESIKMLGKCFTNKGMLDLALQEFKKLVVDDETKELLYDLAQRYEAKKDLVGAKTVYRQLFAADIDYKDVKTRFEMLSGSTSDPMAFEKTSIVQQMSEDAKRRYELLDELGRGAMGIVYRARDKELEEVVALKILPDSMSNNPEAVRRFKIEARNARKLSHPNIVRIHDIGEEMGRKYISMEYVDGSDLKRKVKTQGRLTLPETFHYGIQIAEALSYAHELGIVHRDIKPANIMLTSRDEVKITDFGIAKMLDSTAAEGTMLGAVIGTPLYMSPEQVQGVPVDNRADIYAYGIMLYEFVNGRPPFVEGDLAYQHMHKEPLRPEGCPDALWMVIKKCLEKEKENRWSNAEEIVVALKAARDAVAVG